MPMPASMMAGAHAMPESYDPRIVVLSVLVAILGSYAGLTLVQRVKAVRGRQRLAWLLAGSTSLGGAVWAMHFTGMLAFQLPVTVAYDIPLVVVSAIIAIVGSAATFVIAGQHVITRRVSLLAAVVMGSSIGAMHYTGMAAMRMHARADWDWRIIALSVVVAVGASYAALRITHFLRFGRDATYGWARVGAAGVLGCAVAAMHYTGMAAATFVSEPGAALRGLLVNGHDIGASAIAFIAASVSVAVVAFAVVDRRLSAHRDDASASRRRLSAVVANAPVILLALDADGIITMAEGRDLASVRRGAESILGRSLFDVFHDLPSMAEHARQALAGHEHTAQSSFDGIVLETHWTPIVDADLVVEGVIAVMNDITERRRAEIALKHQALHDSLTDLPNRAFLNESLAALLANASGGNDHVALAILDLDRFKDVNDTLGHDAGDALLQHVAARLRSVLREHDIVARLGGDEFAILLPGAGETEALEIARRLRAALAPSCVVHGRALDVAGSIGLAVAPAHGTDAATLLRHADVAMYAAKRGRDGCAMYDAAFDRDNAARLALKADLRRAIADGALELHYQPKVDVRTHEISRVEALVRWTHPTLGHLPPDRFIPLAEETGLIIPLTDWVLAESMRQARAWEDAGLTLGVAVNISMHSLDEASLPDSVANALLDNRIPADRLTLEFTESAVIHETDCTRANINRLAATGVTLSVDDFGTGYSSLSAIKKLPVSEVKIDKSFVLGMSRSPKDAEIVRLISDLGHNLGLRVVAEGVETADAWEAIAAMGCDASQGYFISRPLPPDDLARFLRESAKPRPLHLVS